LIELHFKTGRGKVKMKNTIVKFLTIAVTAILGSFQPVQAEPVRLVVTHLEPPLVPNSIMDLAVELGYFKREGVEVELIRVQQTPLALAAILGGEGDMANVSVKAVLLLRTRGNDTLKAVTSPNKSLPFLIAAKAAITNSADLTGHSFGVGRIGSLDYALSKRVLDSQGINLDDLDILTLGQPSVRAQALAAGQIDATTMSIGTWLSIPDKTGLSILITPDSYYAAAPVVNKVNVVTEEFLKTRRADAIAVVRALTKISRDFAANPSEWANAMAPHKPHMTQETLQTLAESFVGSWSVNGGIGRTELQFTQDWVFQTDDFKDATSISLDDWVDFTVADQVLMEIGTLPDSDEPSR
jgi:NitT/TauT family transport system substrate-binding protein